MEAVGMKEKARVTLAEGKTEMEVINCGDARLVSSS